MIAVFFGRLGDSGLMIAVDSCSRNGQRAADLALQQGAKRGSFGWRYSLARRSIDTMLSAARHAGWDVRDWRDRRETL